MIENEPKPKQHIRKTPVRLSANELRVIMPGLEAIAFLAEGEPQVPTWYRPHPLPNIAKHLFRLHLALSSKSGSKRYRTRFDFVEVSACALAVRITLKLAARRLIAKWPGMQKLGLRLLAKLERLRKQAKRAAIKIAGFPSYHAVAKSWREFAKHVRQWRLPPKREPLFYQLSPKYLVDECVKIARAELAQKGEEIPPDPKLKELVRGAIRKLHRQGMPGFGTILSGLCGTKGKEFLMSFIQTKLQTEKENNDEHDSHGATTTVEEGSQKGETLTEPSIPETAPAMAEDALERTRNDNL